MIDKNLVYNEILFNKIKNSSHILNIDINTNYIFNENIVKEKKLKIKNLTYNNFEEEKQEKEDKYDFIIFYDLCSYEEKLITTYLEKSKEFIKETGFIILINTLLTNYYYYIYHPFSYIQRYVIGKSVYLTTLDDMLKVIGFKIKNMSRLYSRYILSYPIEYFCIILEK